MSLIGLLVVLLIFCLVAWAVRALLSAFSIGDPIATIVWVVLVIVFVLFIVQSLGVIGGGPILRLR